MGRKMSPEQKAAKASRSQPGGKWSIHISDEGALLRLKTIVAYEAGMRGVSMGQALSQLVDEAADVASYPPAVRQRLAEIEEGTAARAVERSLKMSVGRDG